MTCIATVSTVKSLGAQTPDTISTQVAVGWYLEGLALKIVVFSPQRNIANYRRNGGGFHFSCKPFLVYSNKILLQSEQRADNLNLIFLLFAFSDTLLEPLNSVDLSSLLVNLSP